ncbi:MAG: VCBS domain-containing protein, partial [Cyanobacteria bacterium P01_C01_bin.118]
MISANLPVSNLVVIDAAVENYEVLIGGLKIDAQVVPINSHEDGISRVTQLLSKYQNLTSLHIISHGAPGCLYLGATALNLDTFGHYSSQLQAWSVALAPEANVLLYGCRVAAGDAGTEFLEAFHRLVQRPVTASVSLTGHSALGGNWQLEQSLGTDSWQLAFSAQAMVAYPHVLADPVNTVPAEQDIFVGNDLIFSAGTATELSFTDDNAATGTYRVILRVVTAGAGIIQVGDTTGLSSVFGDGTDSVRLQGSLAEINEALDGARFIHDAGFEDDTAQIQLQTIDFTDRVRDTDLFNVNVNTVNIPPDATDDTNSIVEDVTPNITIGNVVSNDVDPDDILTLTEVEGNSVNISGNTNINGTYGILSINSSGAYTYTLNNGNATVDALDDTQSLTETFNYTISDGDVTDTATLTITINGANDAAIITGDIVGAVVEDATPNTANGTLSATDVDSSTDFVVQTNTPGTYGDFSIDTAGNWTYALDNGNAATNELAAGDTVTDTFTVATDDGTTETVTITITGANEAAVITGDTVGAVTEDAIPNTATGVLAATDVDSSAAFVAQTNAGGTYGDFSIDTAGNWTYTLDNGNGATDALNTGDTVTDTFTVATDDGTTETVVITITGANDAAVITGDTVGTVTEDATPNTATGVLAATDVDSTAAFIAQTNAGGTYGDFSIDTAGNWTYTLDNGNGATDALNTGDTVTDTFTVATNDGTTETVVITITGANDAAVITGDTVGAVTEDAIPNTATGVLAATDADSTAAFVAQTNAGGTYGDFSIDTAG